MGSGESGSCRKRNSHRLRLLATGSAEELGKEKKAKRKFKETEIDG